MVKRVFFFFLALWILAAPVLAAGSTDHSNSVGQNFISPNFVGMGYFSSQKSSVYKDFMVAEDGLIPKSYGSLSDISLKSYPYLYLFYTIPYQTYDNFSLEFDITISAENLGFSSAKLYGGTVSTATDISLSYLCPLYIDDRHSSNGCSFVNLTAGGPYFTNVKYDYFVVELVCNSDSYIDRSISFSESASISGSYSGSNAASTISVSSQPSSAWELVINVDQYSTVLYEYGEGQYRWWDPTAGITQAYINTPFHSGSNGIKFTEAASSESGTMSLSETGTISASDNGTTMVYSSASMLYGNDGGLVDEVFDQGETLDQIAGDMSQIVEDMQAKQDAANDIGGATTEDQICGTQDTVSTGSSALTSGLDTVASMPSYSSEARGYTALMKVAFGDIFTFGHGLYGWTFGIGIFLSVLMAIFRRITA